MISARPEPEPTVAAPATVAVDIVICTYNRAGSLDKVLSGLSEQRVGPGVNWSVLVVDNRSTDSTADVVEFHRARHLLPGLRRVVESEQGLTPARRRGSRETNAPWIAFVDDDTLPEPRWLDSIAEAIRLHPHAGAIGGRVILDWERPPPNSFKDFGYCFAEQDCDSTCEMMTLVGAGMVVRRAALAECGWLERPLIADRVGKRVISGGDIEIAQRIRGRGDTLWYTPDAVLRHRISSSRTSWRYLLRINYGLGAGKALVTALVWPNDWPAWRRAAVRRSVKGLLWPLRRPQGLMGTLGYLAFGIGFARGVLACMTMAPEDREQLLGAGAPKSTSAVALGESASCS
jgi:glycosyltransferase involved in cell wall biosynthesis